MQEKTARSPAVTPTPALVLCDYGQVLAGFDRSLCAQEFAARLGRALPPAGARLLEELLAPFESGALGAEGFLAQLRPVLDLADAAEELAFREAWCRILWAKEDTVAVLRRLLPRPRTRIHVVTNSDPWRLAFARTTLGMADLFQGVTASFEEGVTPKGEDSSMWRVARRRATEALGEEPALVVGIDDLEANLAPALADGTLTHAVVFRDAAGLDAALRELGL